MPLEERRVLRRGAPQALRLEPTPPGAPFLTVSPVHRPEPATRIGARPAFFARLWRPFATAPAR